VLSGITEKKKGARRKVKLRRSMKRESVKGE
jgi:hypothetical protein